LLKRSKFEEACEVALAIPTVVKSHPLSRFLIYCITIRVNDENLDESALLADGPSMPEAESDGVLLACAAETLRHMPENEGVIGKVFQRGSLNLDEWRDRELMIQSHNTMSTSNGLSLLEIDWFTKPSDKSRQGVVSSKHNSTVH
jgi:hypothetical protein